MKPRDADKFEQQWKHYEEGLPSYDPFDVGVVKEHARLAFLAGVRYGRKTPPKKRAKA
jgi:hypothetical protein